MTSNIYYLGAACAAALLVGVNMAFILHLGGNLVAWFKFKIATVTLLLVYIGATLVWDDPAWWRAAIGGAALLLDGAAISWMWRTIIQLAESGHHGLVPLWVDKDYETAD